MADPRSRSSRISTTDCRTLKALVGASISNLAEIALWPDCYGEDGPVLQAHRVGGVDRQEELAGLLGADLRVLPSTAAWRLAQMVTRSWRLIRRSCIA
ncbi:MAG: hypothetical protein JO252_12280 [Planctomycetaceae bacterium]|nr:hypothetical protein [Planctomycetaceae bacterium]